MLALLSWAVGPEHRHNQMGSHEAAANQHPLAEHKYMLTAQQNPTKMDHMRTAIPSCMGIGELWPGFQASSAQLQMPASQNSRSPLRTLMPSNMPSRLLTSSNSCEQQEQLQPKVNHAVGLANPFRSILTDQFATDPTKDLNRRSATHTMGHAPADSSLQQMPAAAAQPAAVPWLPLLDAADFINEPPSCHMGSSDSFPNHTAGHVYTSCFQQLSESQAHDDLATHLCLAAPTTLVIQQAPVGISEPSASSVIPYTSDYIPTGNPRPCATEEVPDSLIHSLHSIQFLHSSQPPFSHDHAGSSGAQQTRTQAPADEWHQQMFYDLSPHDNGLSCNPHDDQPCTTAMHMPVQLSRSRGRSVGQEQECPQADHAGVAAESLSEGVQPICHSSISTDSR